MLGACCIERNIIISSHAQFQCALIDSNCFIDTLYQPLPKIIE